MAPPRRVDIPGSSARRRGIFDRRRSGGPLTGFTTDDSGDDASPFPAAGPRSSIKAKNARASTASVEWRPPATASVEWRGGPSPAATGRTAKSPEDDARFRLSTYQLTPGRTTCAEMAEDAKAALAKCEAANDADARKARTPTDRADGLKQDVFEAERAEFARDAEFERARLEFQLELPPGTLVEAAASPSRRSRGASAAASAPGSPAASPKYKVAPAATDQSTASLEAAALLRTSALEAAASLRASVASIREAAASPRTSAASVPREAAASPRTSAKVPPRRRVETQSFGCQADEEVTGRVILPTAFRKEATRRRARDALARQEHQARALRAIAALEQEESGGDDDDSDDGLFGDEGLLFDAEAGGVAFLHVADVRGARPPEEQPRAPEASPAASPDDASAAASPVKVLTPRGTLADRLEDLERHARLLEEELDENKEEIETFSKRVQKGMRLLREPAAPAAPPAAPRRTSPLRTSAPAYPRPRRNHLLCEILF